MTPRRSDDPDNGIRTHYTLVIGSNGVFIGLCLLESLKTEGKVVEISD